MKKNLLYIMMIIISASVYANNINPALLTDSWPAAWITHPTASPCDYGVYHFRKSLNLEKVPAEFIVHVSADNRYRLFVNGTSVSRGPSVGDAMHWNFDTLNISTYLKKGENTLAATVWNFGDYRPVFQISDNTGFILQADSKEHYVVNTGDSWKVYRNPAYTPWGDWGKTLSTYHVVGPGDIVDGRLYPWGWENPEFDTAGWPAAKVLLSGSPKSINGQKCLTPRTIPFMDERLERFSEIRRTEGIEASPQFVQGRKEITIPENTTASILLDQSYLITAYPKLRVSGGKDSQVVLTYCEAMKDEQGKKGNRNEVEGRKCIGNSDKFIMDGGRLRLFEPLWFRTYRYVQIDIKTQGDPLVIHDLFGQFTAYPFEQKACFQSSDKKLGQIWDISWRTARLCAGETYYDCPYYEQLQYVGDTRIQSLVSLYVAGDDRLVRNAIRFFDYSRTPDGLTQSRYPSHEMQSIPPFSLYWICMIHDYWMHRQDDAFVKSFLPGIQSVLEWYESRLLDSRMLGKLPGWDYVDWTNFQMRNQSKGHRGRPSLDKQGRSSIHTLQFVYTLQRACELAEAMGQADLAGKYKKLASDASKATYELCWDESRGLLADTPEKIDFSQHANILGILTDAVPKEKQKEVMELILAQKDIVQCTMYYKFYLFRAMKKTGLGDRYLDLLRDWDNMMELGLTTWAEVPEPTRSDCHAWSASPMYDFLATVCGIEPASPGFKTVKIRPQLGKLEWVEGKIPHPLGDIQVRLKKTSTGGLEGTVELPPGLTGYFEWGGKSIALKSGQQDVNF